MPFASQRHRISDVEIATIIRSKGEKHALGRVAHVRKMPVGQEVKTPPSQGGITGSIPVQAACRGAEKKSLISRDALAVANASLFLYVNL